MPTSERYGLHVLTQVGGDAPTATTPTATTTSGSEPSDCREAPAALVLGPRAQHQSAVAEHGAASCTTQQFT